MRPSTRHLALGAGLSAGLLIAPSASATNGYFTHGVGTYNKAQAGAGTAAPEQAIDAANNPASGVLIDARTDLGLALFSPHRSYSASASQANGNFGAFSIGEQTIDSDRELFAIPYAAHNWSLGEDRALTALFYGRGGMNTDYSGGTASFDPDGPGPAPVLTLPGTFGDGTAGVDLTQAFFELAFSWRFDNFSLGLAPVFAVQAFEIEGVNTFAGFTRTFAASGGTQMPQSLSANGRDYSVGFGVKIGGIWQATETLSLAASYQSETDMEKFDKYSDLFAGGGAFNIPAVARAGISWKASDRLQLHFDVEHAQYSAIDAVGNPLSNVFACPTSPAGGSDVESCFGGSRGAGFGWDDVTTYKFGGSYRPADSVFTYRFGYNYGEQPIDSADAVINILAPGVIEQHFTLGLTRRMRSGREAGLAFMYAPENTVRGANAFDPSQTIELTMEQFEIEFSWSW